MAKAKATETAGSIRARNSTADMLVFNVRIEGALGSMLIMHNGQLSDPMNNYARALKTVSGKKKKTEADYEEMARIEMEGGLWLNAEKRPCIPGMAIDAMLQGAASIYKLGKKFAAAVMTDSESYLLEHDGPKDVDALSNDPRFRDRRRVKIDRVAVWRTRPKFDKWAVEFSVCLINDAGVTEDNLRQALEDAGRRIGLGDYRPKFGHFVVTKFERA